MRVEISISAKNAWPSLLGATVQAITISAEIAEGIADALGTSDAEAHQQRRYARRAAEQRRQTVVAKLDRGYDITSRDGCPTAYGPES